MENNQIKNFFNDLYSSYFIQHRKKVVRRILKIIFNKDKLILDSVISQYTITNVENRSIALDVLAKDKDNNIYNIEFQNQNIKGLNKRARFHHSMIDSNNFKKNTDFDELNNTYVIFICNFDPFKQGKPLYEIIKKVKEDESNYIDNQHTIFVNCKYKDTSTEIGKLIQDINSNNTDEKWYNEFKEGKKKGGKSMGDGYQKMVNQIKHEGKVEGKAEGRAENKKEIVREMIKEHFTNEIISKICKVNSNYIDKLRKKN